MPRGQPKKSQEDLENGGLGHCAIRTSSTTYLPLEKHDFVRFDLQLAGEEEFLVVDEIMTFFTVTITATFLNFGAKLRS